MSVVCLSPRLKSGVKIKNKQTRTLVLVKYPKILNICTVSVQVHFFILKKAKSKIYIVSNVLMKTENLTAIKFSVCKQRVLIFLPILNLLMFRIVQNVLLFKTVLNIFLSVLLQYLKIKRFVSVRDSDKINSRSCML